MKRVLLLLCCVALAVACDNVKKSSYETVDERNVPEKFVKDFKRQKPSVEQVKWEKIDSLTYRANFVSNGNKTRMQFTNANVLSSWIIPQEFCEVIQNYVAKTYEGYKISEVVLADKDKKTKAYFVTIYKKKEVKELEFDLMQVFVKEITENQEPK